MGLVLPALRGYGLAPDVLVVVWRRPEATMAALRVRGSHYSMRWRCGRRIWSPYSTAPVGYRWWGSTPTSSTPTVSSRDTFWKDLATLGCALPAEVADSIAATVPTLAAPELAPEVSSTWDRLEPALHAVRGAHPAWTPPSGLAISPWAAEVLAAHAARTVAPEVEVARGAADEPVVETVAVRRELWRLRDEVLGLEAERANLTAALYTTDAKWKAAEHRADTLAARFVDLDLDELARRTRPT